MTPNRGVPAAGRGNEQVNHWAGASGLAAIERRAGERPPAGLAAFAVEPDQLARDVAAIEHACAAFVFEGRSTPSAIDSSGSARRRILNAMPVEAAMVLGLTLAVFVGAVAAIVKLGG